MVDKYDNYELKKVNSLENVPGVIKDGDGYIWDPSGLPDNDFDVSKVPLEYRRLATWMRSKLFGKEVRETIARFVELSGVIDDRQKSVESFLLDFIRSVSESEINSGPEIVQARGGKATLGARLDETTAQLAQTDYEARRKKDLDDFTPRTLAAIEGGGGTSFNLLSIPREGSVEPKSTNFFHTSNNIFNIEKILKNTAIRGAAGGDTPPGESYALPGYFTSEFIRVAPSKVYTAIGVSRIAFYDYSRKYISKLENYYHEEITFTSPENCFFIRVHDENPFLDTTQINEGNTLKEYDTYSATLKDEVIGNRSIDSEKIDLDSIGVEHLNIIKKSTNYFNPDETIEGKAIHSSAGELYDLSGYEATSFLPVKEGQSWTVRGFERVYLYTSEKTGLPDLSNTYLHLPINETHTIVIPKGVAYIRLHTLTTFDNTQLNKGGNLLPYEPYYKYIDKSLIDTSDFKIEKEEKPYIFVPDEIGRNFITDGDDFEVLSVSEIYEGYNQLIEAYPNFISKKVLGKDTSGEYDVLEIHLKPEEYDGVTTGYGGGNNLNDKRPKITFIANIHGAERPTALATYYMTKAICEEWQSSDVLEYLRWNVEFKFIPIVFPYGYDNNLYSNTTGVNLQTNFPYNFIVRPEDSNVYGGTEPLTEIETIYCKDFIDENTDSIFFMDLHSAPYGEDFAEGVDSMFYFLLEKGEHYNKDIEISAKYGVESISRLMKKNYPITTNNLLGWIQYRNGQGTADAYANSLGIPSLILEVPRNVLFGEGDSMRNALKPSTEILINSILTVLRRYKDVY